MLYLLWWSCCDPLSLIKVTFFEWLAGLVLNQLSYQARAIEMKVFKNILWRAFQKKSSVQILPNISFYFWQVVIVFVLLCIEIDDAIVVVVVVVVGHISAFSINVQSVVSQLGKKIPPRSDFCLPKFFACFKITFASNCDLLFVFWLNHHHDHHYLSFFSSGYWSRRFFTILKLFWENFLCFDDEKSPLLL